MSGPIPAVFSISRLLFFLKENLKELKNLTVQSLTINQHSKFFVYLSSTQANLTDNASTTIEFDTVKTDTTDSYDNSTYKFTANRTGPYFFRSQCMLNDVPNATGAVGYLKFIHADADDVLLGTYVGQYYTFEDFNPDPNFQYFPLYASALISMTKGDTLKTQVALASVGASTVDVFGHTTNLGATGFSGFMIP